MPDRASAQIPRPSTASAFKHLWAPSRLAWWIALLFAIGASLFTLAASSAVWPQLTPELAGNGQLQARVFVAGAIFFTSAAWLQWLEAVNGDVAEALQDRGKTVWHWFGWRPANLGYLASATQLIGTVMFNINTLDALIPGLGWAQQDLLIWLPNILGCLCFLAASLLAYAEVAQGTVWLAPKSISWWIAIINLLGSIAFQISALYSLAGPAGDNPQHLFLANVYTAVGGLCFFIGAYLMIPELFDEEVLDTGITRSDG